MAESITSLLAICVLIALLFLFVLFGAAFGFVAFQLLVAAVVVAAGTLIVLGLAMLVLIAIDQAEKLKRRFGDRPARVA